MRPKYLLVLDAGTGAGRCFVVDLDGQKCFLSQQEWSFSRPIDSPLSGFDFDSDEFWEALTRATRNVLASSNISPADVIAVSTTSMREGFVLLDEKGKEIFAVPNYDQRSTQEAFEVQQECGQRIYQASGRWPTDIFATSRLRWLHRYHPEIYDSADCLLMINDWIAYKLCGEIGCEPSNAEETGLYDVHQRKWCNDIIDELSYPQKLFPKVRTPGTLLGYLHKDAARATGLISGTPVIVGGGDTQCAVLGSGASAHGEVVAIAGTSTPVQMILDNPILDPEARSWTGAHVVPGQWVLETGSSYTGSALRWFRDNFCQVEVIRSKQTGTNAFELMLSEAERAPIGARGIIAQFGAEILNARRPYSAPGGFIIASPPSQISQFDTKSLFIRAIVESFAYAIRANCDLLTKISTINIDHLFVVGGITSSNFWVQMLADVMGIPVYLPQFSEGSSLGAAICAGIGANVFSDFKEGSSRLVHTKCVLPDKKRSLEYEQSYNNWISVYQSMNQVSFDQ